MIVPKWPAQAWYPVYMSMLDSEPLYLNPNKYLLCSIDRRPHPLWKRITLVAIRKAFELREVPIEATDIMLSSLAESSIKKYDSCLKKWWKFCKDSNFNPFKGTLTEVLKFLTEEFQEGRASYGTLNSCRSAIALLRGPEVGEDARMRRFFKGVEK